MLRNMVTSLLKYERIHTTDAKAKELRSWADHLITLAKRGDLHARRQALAVVQEAAVVHKLFENAAERFGATAGGYTRIVKLGPRPGDAAPMAMIELVIPDSQRKKKPVKGKPAQKKAAKSAAAPVAVPEADAAPAAEAVQAPVAEAAPAPEEAAPQADPELPKAQQPE